MAAVTEEKPMTLEEQAAIFMAHALRSAPENAPGSVEVGGIESLWKLASEGFSGKEFAGKPFILDRRSSPDSESFVIVHSADTSAPLGSSATLTVFAEKGRETFHIHHEADEGYCIKTYVPYRKAVGLLGDFRGNPYKLNFKSRPEAGP